ncbi:MAG TPA: hypothetical protein VFH03_09080 [Actinoplanes sp.]|nr:hypothetical protein [Actinoplanes sp.]
MAAAREDGQTAATLLGTAARWRCHAHRPATPLEQRDIARAAERGRALLGPAADEAAWAAALTQPQDPLLPQQVDR